MKATKTNRFDQLVSGIKKVDKESRKKCNRSINKNTEAFLVTKLSDYLYKKFSTLHYKLEVRPAEILKQLGYSNDAIEKYKDEKDLRINGFLDSVLYYSSTTGIEKPAHIIEFKRGGKIESIQKDCVRLATLVNAAQRSQKKHKRSNRHRLETAYFITTMRQPNALAERKVEDAFHKKLEKINNNIKTSFQEVNFKYITFKVGPNQIDFKVDNYDVWAAIIEISPL
jgi:hypothetical protein